MPLSSLPRNKTEFWHCPCSAQRTSFWPVARVTQLTSFYVVASCGLLPRTTRPGPRVRTAFWSVAILPLRDTRQSWTWSAPITECSVILSEASLRAESKDPQLVASSAWVADPSQANVILSEASLRAESKGPQLIASSAWVADPSQAQDDIQPVEDPKPTGRCT